MPFQPFELEHFQSQFERTVEINLADSSVQCANMRELVNGAEAQELLNLDLPYPEVNGTHRLRERIAALYPRADASNILVTVGAAQANSMVCSTLLEPGDAVVVVSPGYRQVWGLAQNLGCRVREVELIPDNGWVLDLDCLESVCSSATKMVSIVNPNNPTGTILSAEEMRRIVKICERHGSWLHADEVYRGTEFHQEETPSFWREYDKVICVNSMSKAYGLAGLRIGWIVATPDMIESLWRRHEYAVIAAAGPSMTLAEIALQDGKRKMLLDRQRRLSSAGHQILRNWIQEQHGAFSIVEPAATSVAFVRYHFDVPSCELAGHIRERSSVLVAPGALLGAEHHLRMAVGVDANKLTSALARIGASVGEMEITSAR